MLLSKFKQIQSPTNRILLNFWNKRGYCSTLDKSTCENDKQNCVNEYVTLNFIKEKDGTKYKIKALVGEDIMQSVREAGMYKEFDEFGFCGGNRYCTSCHVLFESDFYQSLPEMCEKEYKYVSFLSNYKHGVSRLGCQVDVTKEMDGILLVLPYRQDQD